MRSHLLAILCLLLAGSKPLSAILPSNLYFDQLDNGLKVMVLKDPNMKDTQLQMTFKGGAIAEPPYHDGLFHLYEHMLLSKDRIEKHGKLQPVSQISFGDTTGLERVSYRLTVPKPQIVNGLRYFYKVIRDPEFDRKDLQRAQRTIDAEYQQSQQYPLFLLNQDMKRHLWHPFYSRKNRFGDPEVIREATLQVLDTLRKRFFRPQNALLAVAGDVEPEEVFDHVFRIYRQWPKANSMPLQQFSLPNFPRLKHSGQFLTVSSTTGQPVYMVSFQGPDFRYDAQSTYAADLFAEILSAPDSRLQRVLVDSGLASRVAVQFRTIKYKSPLRVVVVADSAYIEEAHHALLREMKRWGSDHYFSEAQLANAKQRLIQKHAGIRQKPLVHLDHLSRMWASASFNYHAGYKDSIRTTTRSDIQDFVKEYVDEKEYMAGLIVDSTTRSHQHVDSFFTNTPADVSKLKFHFEPNSARFKSRKDSLNILSLFQWMQINPRMQLKINGRADKSEFLKIRKKKYLTYMDTTDNFTVPHRLILPKRYVRLDILRSLKIVKSLTDAGIDSERLAGSGRLEEGENQEEVKENRKASIEVKNY